MVHYRRPVASWAGEVAAPVDTLERKEDKAQVRPGVLGRWSPPFYYGWVIVAVVFLGEFIGSGASMMGFPLFVQPLREHFNWSLTQVITAVTFHSVFMMVSAPLIGPLLDRYGGRPVMAAGAVVVAVSLVLTSRIEELWQLWLFYGVLAAVGINMMGHLAAAVSVPKWFIRKRGRAVAATTIGNSSGGMVFVPIIGFLIVAVGWRDTWVVLAAVVLVMLPISLIFMRRRPEDVGLLPDGDEPDGAQDRARFPSRPAAVQEDAWTLKEALRTRTLWVLVGSMNLLALAAGAPIALIVPFLVEQQGMSPEQAPFVFTAALLGATISRIMWGFLAERHTLRMCMAIMFFSRALGPMLLIVVPYPFNTVAFVIFWGGIGGSFILFQGLVWANYYGRTFVGSIQGTMRPLLSITQFGGPLFIAVLVDIRGTYDLAFTLATVMGLIGAALVLLASPPVRPTAVPAKAPVPSS